MSLFRQLVKLLEPLLLMGLGTAMLALAVSGRSLLLLHPGLIPLSGGTGGVLCLLAFALLTRPTARSRPFTVITFAAFLALLALAGNVAAPSLTGTDGRSRARTDAPGETFDPGDPPASSFGESGSTARELQPETATLNGQTYTRLNLAELYVLADKDDPDGVSPEERQAILAGRYLVRGMVMRSPELDARGLALVYRPHMYCCLADAVAVAFFVQNAPVAALADGEWVRVYGSLAAAASLTEALVPRIPGVFTVAPHLGYLLRAARVEHAKPPEMPFIFIVSQEPPYNY